jgi:hypothetical protein
MTTGLFVIGTIWNVRWRLMAAGAVVVCGILAVFLGGKVSALLRFSGDAGIYAMLVICALLVVYCGAAGDYLRSRW